MNMPEILRVNASQIENSNKTEILSPQTLAVWCWVSLSNSNKYARLSAPIRAHFNPFTRISTSTNGIILHSPNIHLNCKNVAKFVRYVQNCYYVFSFFNILSSLHILSVHEYSTSSVPFDFSLNQQQFSVRYLKLHFFSLFAIDYSIRWYSQMYKKTHWMAKSTIFVDKIDWEIQKQSYGKLWEIIIYIHVCIDCKRMGDRDTESGMRIGMKDTYSLYMTHKMTDYDLFLLSTLSIEISSSLLPSSSLFIRIFTFSSIRLIHFIEICRLHHVRCRTRESSSPHGIIHTCNLTSSWIYRANNAQREIIVNE